MLHIDERSRRVAGWLEQEVTIEVFFTPSTLINSSPLFSSLRAPQPDLPSTAQINHYVRALSSLPCSTSPSVASQPYPNRAPHPLPLDPSFIILQHPSLLQNLQHPFIPQREAQAAQRWHEIAP
jgi:hypothetical protein